MLVLPIRKKWKEFEKKIKNIRRSLNKKRKKTLQK